MLQLCTVMNRNATFASRRLVARTPRTLDFENDCAVEAEAIERGPHPLQPLVNQAHRLHLDPHLGLVSAPCAALELAPPARRGGVGAFSCPPGLNRPERAWGFERAFTHDDRCVAGADPIEPPAVPVRGVLMQPLNPGHELSPCESASSSSG